MNKSFANSSIRNVLLVLSILVLSVLSLYVVSPTPQRLFVGWNAVPLSNWLRYGAAMLLSAFLPGFLLFDSLNMKGAESPVRYFIFSYLLSVFIVTLSNVAAFLVSGSWIPLNVLLIINGALFGVWLVTKRGKINCSRFSYKLVLAISALALFFIVVSSIHNFFIYGDQFNYHAWALGWAANPFRSLNGIIQPSYPWWTIAYLSTLFGTSGLPSVNTYVPLMVMNMMPVVAFFCLIRTKANTIVSIIAAFLAFFSSGFGWLYFSFIQAGSQVDKLQQLGWKTYDITLPNSFLTVTPDVSTALLLVGLPSLIASLALVIDENQAIFQKRNCLLVTVFTALAFLSHMEAGVILTGIYCLLILTNYLKDIRLQLSFLLGLIFVSIIDLAVPISYYNSIIVTISQTNFSLLPASIAAISIVILFAQIYRLRFFSVFSARAVQNVKKFFSKLHSMDVHLTRHRFFVKDNSIALVLVLAYLVTLIFYSVYIFPTFHFSTSYIQWYIYPVKLGIVGTLALGFLLGCIFFQWHQKEKLPYILLVGIPLILFLGYYSFYSEQRLMKYLPLLLTPFAAVSLTRLANSFYSKFRSRISARIVQIVTISLILFLSVPSMLLYFQYEALSQDATHYPTLARRISPSGSILSAADFLFKNSNFSDTIATFPQGYGGIYSYIGDLSGRWKESTFLPIFAIKQPVNFFKVASDIQLKYVYLGAVEEGLVNKYYNDGFLNFYTSIASIVHETNETKIYSVPKLYAPSENPECYVLDLTAFAQSPSSKNFSLLSYLLLGLSGVQYTPYSYTFTAINSQVDTIVMTADPEPTSIDRYLDWVNNGGNIVVLACDQLGSFSTFLRLTETGFSEANSIRTADSSISIPNIYFQLIASQDSNVAVQAYYAQDQELKAPFILERKLGNGTIKYLYLAPLFSHMLSSGNGSVDVLAQIAPPLMRMLGFKTNLSSADGNLSIPNYVLEKPTYSGNLTGTTDYLTFYASEITIRQSDSTEQHFEDASVEVIGPVNFSINNATGSISTGIPHQEIDPTEVYNDGKFWSIYHGTGKGTVGSPSIVQDVNTVSGNSNTEVAIESGSYKISGVYHDFGTTDWSSTNRIGLNIYGSGTNSHVTLSLYTGAETWDSAISWEIVENFEGWKKFTLDFSSSTYIGSDFNISDIKKMYVWFDTPGTWYIDRITLDSSGPMQSMPSITYSDNIPKDLELILSNKSQLVITSGSQDVLISVPGNQKLFVTASPSDIFLHSFATNLAIDGIVTFKGAYGYWLEATPAVHDTISISGKTSFKPTFSEWITYVYAEDSFRNFVVRYNSNPIIYISNLNITGKYTSVDEK